MSVATTQHHSVTGLEFSDISDTELPVVARHCKRQQSVTFPPGIPPVSTSARAEDSSTYAYVRTAFVPWKPPLRSQRIEGPMWVGLSRSATATPASASTSLPCWSCTSNQPSFDISPSAPPSTRRKDNPSSRQSSLSTLTTLVPLSQPPLPRKPPLPPTPKKAQQAPKKLAEHDEQLPQMIKLLPARNAR